MNPTRRQFLKFPPCLALGSPLLATGQQSQEQPSPQFPTKPRDRLAVTSWPFRAYIESPTNRNRDRKNPGMDLLEFPALIVTKFGVYNINPLGGHFRSTDPAYLDAFRRAVEKAKSHMVDLGLGGGAFYATDQSSRQAAVDSSRKWIDIARAIGSPSVRQHVGRSGGAKPDVALAAESLGQLADYGSKRGIVVNLENDDPVAEDPFFLVSIVQKVNSRYLRALPDFGNSLIGHDAAYNQRAVEAMLKYAYNMCHVKDSVQSDDGKRSTVDLEKMFEIAKASSFKGYYSMEYDTSAGDPFAGTEKLIQQTLKYI
jgi:sugar phosphate isomerase/epimerase